MGGKFTIPFRVAGTTVDESIYNSDLQVIIDNFIPKKMDDHSESVTEMKTVTDPNPSDTPSQATTLAGELERLRFQIHKIVGRVWWGELPNNNLEALSVVDVDIRKERRKANG